MEATSSSVAAEFGKPLVRPGRPVQPPARPLGS
jgi:hypothetical protein